MAFAEQANLPLLQINVSKVHAYQLCKTHTAVEEQHHHAVVPLREIALGLGALQKRDGLLCRQVLGQYFILLGRTDSRRRVLR